MNALAVISQLPDTRAQKETFIHAAIEEIVNGDNNPALIFAKLRIIGDAIKGILESKRVQDAAMTEVLKYSGDCEINGNKITIQSKRAFDFSGCNDSILAFHEQEYESAKKSIEDRKTFLKGLKPGMIAIDEQTGEQLAPPAVSVTEFIVVK